MDFKSLLSQLDQLNEATEKTKTGVRHTAEPGGYGRKDDEDEEGNKVKSDAPKKGRGRPSKATQSSGEAKKYDFSAFGVKSGKDVKLPKHDKKKTTVVKGKSQNHPDNKKDDGTGDEPTTKKGLKEYFDSLDRALNEAEQIQIKPASQMPKKPGQTSQAQPGQPQQVQGQAQQNTQVIAQGDKTLGTVNNPQLANQIKQSIGKGEMTLNPDQQMKEGSGYDGSEPLDLNKNPSVNDVFKRALYIYDYEGYGNNMDYSEDDAIDQYVAKNFGLDVLDQLTNARTQGYFGRADGKGPGGGGRTSNLGTSSAPGGNFRTTKAGVMNKQDAKTMKSRVADRLGRHPEPNLPEGDIGKHNNATTGFDAMVRKLTPKYGKEAATKIAGAQMKKIKEADQPPRDALASPLTFEAKKPDANKNGIPDYAEDGKGPNDTKKKKVKEDMDSESKTDKKKCPPMSHIKKMCQDGKSVAEICKMHPDCDQKELKQMVADCKKKMVKEGITSMKNTFAILDDNLIDQIANMNGAEVDPDAGTVETWDENTFRQLNAFAQKNPSRLKRTQSMNTAGMRPMARAVGGTASGPEYNLKEGMNTRLKAARHAGKSHALGKQGYNCSYDDMEESRHYHEGYKEGLDECYGQMPIQGYVGEANPPATVPGMANQAMREPAMEDDMYEVDKTTYMKQQAMKTPGDTFKAFGQTFKDKEVVESPFAFEALEQQLNALLESKEDVAEGMTVSISKGQQGAPDSVSVSAQDAEADQLLGLIKSAGLGLFGADEQNGYGAPQGGQPQHGGLDVVGDHDGMMALIKKVTGGEAGNGDYADEEGHGDEHGHEGTCESCGGMMEAGHACGEGQQMVDEVESEDQMTYQMAEDNPPDSGADNTNAAIADTAQANAAGAAYNPKNDVDEGAGGPEASEEPVEKLTPDEEDQSDEEGEEEKSAEEEDKADKESMSESMFVNLYKKLTLISEESTSEKDDKAEKAAKKVAKDIEYDEDHKGKDDDKAEEAGKKVKKDIEYDDKKDKKKIDEWANDAGPGKSASDTAFETDIDFMMNVISGGLNKRKQTGQTTIPVIAGQNRTTSRNTTDINESKYSSDDAVAQWKKLAGLK
jgi:hypothetical protein